MAALTSPKEGSSPVCSGAMKPGVPSTVVGLRQLLRGVFGAGQAEVDQDRGGRFGLGGEQDVVGLEIPVNHTVGVHPLQAAGEITSNPGSLPRRERPVGLEPLLQARPRDPAHHQIWQPIDLAGGVHRDDVGMLNPCTEVRLPPSTGPG